MKRRYHTNQAWFDILFLMGLAFVVLFIIAVVQMNPAKVEAHDAPKPKAEFFVTVTWPAKFDDDVDTYVQDPVGNFVYFSRRENGLLHLDRDDLGHRNDTINTPDGNVQYDANQEIVIIRGIVPGEYIVNVHMFHRNMTDPVPVTVRLDKINPTYKNLRTQMVTLQYNGDEQTAFRFILNKDGDVVGFNRLEKRFTGITGPGNQGEPGE